MGDKGSALGRFFYKLVNGNRFWANALTRGTIGLGIGLSLLSIPILIGNWLISVLGVLGIIATQAFISWRNLGGFKFKLFGKEIELTWVDILNYAIIGVCIFAIITYKIL